LTGPVYALIARFAGVSVTPNGEGAARKEVNLMAKDHGSSVKDDKQYEGLRKKGMSKERAAKIANTPGASKKGGKKSQGGSGGGSKEGQRKGGRKGGKKSS
jgi:hypothetical protein